MKEARRDDVILSPRKPSRPKRGYFPFSLGKREPDSFTVGPYQIGIIIHDGIVEYVFEGEKRSLPEGELQTYIASTAPFKLIFRFKGPGGPSQPDDIELDPPLLTADGQHLTGRIDLTLSVITQGSMLTSVMPEGAHRLLQLLGLDGDVITKSDVADVIKAELLPRLLAVDLHGYTADELLSNRELLRDISDPLKTELASTIDRFGLQLVDFHANWAPTPEKPSQHEGFRPAGADIHARDDDGLMSLHEAAAHGYTEKALALISSGADVDARSHMGGHMDFTALHAAALRGHTETVKALISSGADINARGHMGATPLHAAAWTGHIETALALVSKGADINARNDGNLTPLHMAAWSGHIETALTLVSKGADINARGDENLTPLHMAAGWGQTETVLALISAGVEINARDNNGFTPLLLAVAHTETALALISSGADINARNNDGMTCLQLAAIGDHTETVKALISSGADVNARGHMDWTALHAAAMQGCTETVKALISSGAVINARGYMGATPLHAAAGSGHIETALALVSKGADINARGDGGQTPLDLANVGGYSETVLALISAGADHVRGW